MGKVISAANGAKAHSDGHALAATSHSWRCSLPLSDPSSDISLQWFLCAVLVEAAGSSDLGLSLQYL